MNMQETGRTYGYAPTASTNRKTPRTRQAMSLRHLILPVLVLILAFALRVDGLDHVNFNWDEGYSNWIIHLPFAEMIETTARDVHPPLYYLLLRGSNVLFGDGEFALRYPSVLVGVLTVAAAFALGRLVGGYRVGLLALLLLAVARANIDISQLSRMHILATLFSTGGLWASVRLWRNPRRRGAMALYVVCIAGALYSFYLALVLPLATNLAFLVVWWRRGRPRDLFIRWALLQIAAALVFLPWALYAVQQMHGWNAEQDTSFLFFIQVYFVVLTTGVSAFWDNYLPWVLLALGMMAAGAFVIYRRRQRVDDLILMIAALMTPVLVVFLLTLPIHNLGRPLAARYLILTAAGFYVLAAWSIFILLQRQRIAGAISAMLIVGLAVVGLVDTEEISVRRDLFVSLADTLEAHEQPEDAVLLYNDRQWPLINAQYTGEWVGVPHEMPVDAAYADYLLAPLWESAQAVWVVEYPGALVNDPNGYVKSWLEERAIRSQSWAFNENTLTVYARTEARAATLDQLAADYPLPETPLDPDSGLRNVEQPMHRYPIGDSIYLALLWDTPHPQTVAFTLVNDEHEYIFDFDVPENSQRTQISLPLTPEIPAGDYDLVMTEPRRLHLSEVTLVNTLPDVGGDADTIPYRLDWRFGESLHLLGYDVADTTLTAGDTVTVTLYWRTDAVLDQRYKVLTYALGDFNVQTNNPLWGQHDTEPRDWQFPTTQWPPDTVITEVKSFEIYDYTPPGDYEIGVVVYGLVDGARLTIHDADGNPVGDMATMFMVRVE